MKITNIRTVVVGNPWKNWIFVIIETDKGLTGLGEATGGLKTRSFEADVPEIGRFVIGEDPTQPERVTLDETEAARYPYGQNNFLRLFEEGWERRNH